MPNQPSSRAPRADEVYIFASRGIYMSESVVITITRLGDTISLTTERPYAFTEHRSKRRLLSPAEWTEFRSALECTGFWSMSQSDDNIGLDGHTWSITGRSGEREHSLERWSPSGGPFFELGSLFAKLAGVGLTYDPP
jgi:hypothetical protein